MYVHYFTTYHGKMSLYKSKAMYYFKYYLVYSSGIKYK